MNAKEVVLTQIQQYNNEDIENCLKYCCDEIEVFLLPDCESLLKGKEVLKSHLQKSFGTGEFEAVEVIEAIELGNYVTTIEKKIKRSTKEERTLLITYQLEAGLIMNMWAARK